MTSRSRNRTTTSTGGSARDAHRPRGGRGGGWEWDGARLDIAVMGAISTAGLPSRPEEPGKGPCPPPPRLCAPDGAGGAGASCPLAAGDAPWAWSGNGEKRPGVAPRSPVGTPGRISMRTSLTWSLLAAPLHRAGQGLPPSARSVGAPTRVGSHSLSPGDRKRGAGEVEWRKITTRELPGPATLGRLF